MDAQAVVWEYITTPARGRHYHKLCAEIVARAKELSAHEYKTREDCIKHVAVCLRTALEEEIPPYPRTGHLWRAMIASALRSVNWWEVAENLLDDWRHPSERKEVYEGD